MILNLIVILVMLIMRVLCRNVIMFFIGNMVVSDFMISLYMIILVSVRLKLYMEFLLIMDSFCNVIGFMWFIG